VLGSTPADMHSLSTFDVPYAVRQLTSLTALVMAPAWAFGISQGRRLMLFIVALASVCLDLWLLYGTFAASRRIWEQTAFPYAPFKVGPSYLSLLDLCPVVIVVLWVPFGLYWIFEFWRHRQHASSSARVIRVLCAYIVAATAVTTVIVEVGEYAHEDTVFSDGFSLTKWRKVHDGMTRTEVRAVLGEPLAGHCSFAADAECWVSNFSAGQFAAVWFKNDKAFRIQRWYSD
jgi:hypothetical protein